jgi:hypothetical protein
MNFSSTHYINLKKADSANFASGRIINHRTLHSSCCRDEQTLGGQLGNGLQGSELSDAILNARALLCYIINGVYFLNNPCI